MSQKPIGFMSYVRLDDEHENGRISEFCKRLSGEVRVQTGERFDIFQDRNDIGWGQQWKERIEESLDAVTFLIPMITPGFFKSRACRLEPERFIEREQQLGRNDLILPVYYVGSPVLDDEKKREDDPLAQVIASRQYVDWRELRFETFTTPQVGKMLAKIAAQIVDALERGKPIPPPAPASAGAASRPSSRSASVEEQISDAARQTVETVHPPAHKTEPPTRVVDAFYLGDQASLAEALKKARPGDRILVRPGLYQEGVVIDKPVEIIGDGEPGEVVIEAAGKNTILFQASMGRIANLTLRQAGGGEWYCIDIAQGRLDVEACDITSQSLSCVAIHSGADPRLRRNRIHDGKVSGVFVQDNGLGTLEDNDIFANAYSGVEIKTGGSPTLRRNRIHENKEDGVFVYDNGLGTLEDNEIFANAYSGVEIKTGGNPSLRRNRIHDGKTGGVIVRENGQGMLEDNEIFANAYSGVEIGTDGNPTLRRNRIHDGRQTGIFVYDNGLGTLEDNEIFSNAYSGVEVKTGGNPTLRRNQITKNKYHGIWVHEGGGGIFEENDLRENDGGTWNIAPECQNKVKRTGNLE